MTETDLKNKIRVELSKKGCKVFNRPTGQFYRKTAAGYSPVKIGEKGQSDLSGHNPDGEAFYIEVKNPNGKGIKSKEQVDFIEAMIKSGARAGFAESLQEALEIAEVL